MIYRNLSLIMRVELVVGGVNAALIKNATKTQKIFTKSQKTLDKAPIDGYNSF